jgi:hypothetical protein
MTAKRIGFILLVVCTVALCGFILWVMIRLPIM